MKLLDKKNEKQIIKREKKPCKILIARKVLEETLKIQFRKIADGLLADLLLQGYPIYKLNWWWHYFSKLSAFNSYSPDYNKPDFKKFKEKFIKDIHKKKIKAIKLSDLNDIEIRVFNGFIKLWNDVEINRQLSLLGSSCRIVFIGSNNVATNSILQLLGKENSIQKKVDGRFIFGSVGDITTTMIGPLYDFEREFAVSPYIPGEVQGFTYKNRIVLRQQVIWYDVENLQADKNGILNIAGISNGDKEEGLGAYFKRKDKRKIFQTQWIMTFFHEFGHQSPFYNFNYFKGFWMEDIKNDMCRYTETPRSFNEINNTFKLAYALPSKEITFNHIHEKPEIKDLVKIEDILNEMRNEDSINFSSEGKIQCKKYKKRLKPDWIILH